MADRRGSRSARPWGRGGPTVNVNRQIAKKLPKKMSQLVTRDFYDYFAVKYLRAKHAVCAIPTWMYWDIDKKGSIELRIPDKEFNQCMKSANRFVSIPMCLRSIEGGSHANALFIDKDAKTAERFEPHGARAYELFKDFKYEELDEALANVLAQKTLQYIAPSQYAPKLGPQSMEHYIGESGYCAGWSLWYTDMRLTYPEVPRDVLAKALFSKLNDKYDDDTLTSYLLNYVRQVYAYMVKEFPQYRQFLYKYDDYKKLPKTDEKRIAFQRFQDHMNDLVNNQPMKRIRIPKSTMRYPSAIESRDLYSKPTKVSVKRYKK